MLMNSVLHNFSLRSHSVGRLAAMMASVYDLSWKMTALPVSGCILSVVFAFL